MFVGCFVLFGLLRAGDGFPSSARAAIETRTTLAQAIKSTPCGALTDPNARNNDISYTLKLTKRLVTVFRMGNEPDVVTRWSFASADYAAMRSVRSEVLAKLRQHGDARADYTACELTIGELFANAIMHAPPGTVSVSLDWTAARPLVRVRDDGPGFTPVVARPDPTLPGGRGLYIISQLAGTVRVDVDPQEGCTVAVELPITKRPT